MKIHKFTRKFDNKVVEAIQASDDIPQTIDTILSWFVQSQYSGALMLGEGDWVVYDGVNNPYVCDAEDFDKVYEPIKVEAEVTMATENLSFSRAIELVKAGYCVARKGWNGKNQFIYLIKGTDLQKALQYGYGEYEGEPTIQSAIAIKTSANLIQVGWVASQADMLSDDWVWLNPPQPK